MAINEVTHEDVEDFEQACHNGIWHNSGKYAGGTLDYYQKLATRSAIYPGQGTPIGLVYVALKMNGEAGEFAEHVGKSLRDENLMPLVDLESDMRSYEMASLANDLVEHRRELLIKEIGDVLWYLSAACNELGISLSDAAVTNLRKLADRSARGKLQGSGDVR